MALLAAQRVSAAGISRAEAAALPVLPRRCAVPAAPHRAARLSCHASSDSWVATAPPTQPRPAATVGDAPKQATVRSARDLKDPLHIGGSKSASLAVPDQPGPLSLEEYMRLPIEQYFVLDSQKIRFLGGNRFGLSVPRLELLGTWLEPKIEVTVIQEEDAVVLIADNCHIQGSALINSLNLDKHFCMTFTTRLTWERSTDSDAVRFSTSSAASTSGGSSSSNSSSSAAAPALPQKTGLARLDFLNTGIFDGLSQAPAAQPTASVGKLHGNAQLDVWCEVIPPFNFMPRAALAASCNAVINSLLNTLLPLFVKQLSADYVRWSSDAAYRQERAARSNPLAY